MTLVEDIGGQKNVPMCSTGDSDIQALREMISFAADYEAATGKSLSTPKKEAGKRKPGRIKVSRLVADTIIFCDHYAEYLSDMGPISEEEDKLSMNEVRDALLALKDQQKNFKNVLGILLKRFGRNFPRFINDRTVASLVSLLLDGRKIDALLATINSPVGMDLSGGRSGSNLECGGSTGISGMDDL